MSSGPHQQLTEHRSQVEMVYTLALSTVPTAPPGPPEWEQQRPTPEGGLGG